mgnify:CR=1 FL=1
MGNPLLREVAKSIADPTSTEIKALAHDLIDTCEDIGGNGIAAPQVYDSRRMFVYRVRTNIMPAGVSMQPIDWTVCINPSIEFLSEDRSLYWERCLSLPDQLIDHDSQAGQLALAGIDSDGIAAALQRLANGAETAKPARKTRK